MLKVGDLLRHVRNTLHEINWHTSDEEKQMSQGAVFGMGSEASHRLFGNKLLSRM